MTDDGINHGTRSGYVQHGRRGSKACAECRAAEATYHRARQRAYGRLAKLQPTLYRAIFEEELGRST